MNRLTIDMTDRQHQHSKAFAALQGKTVGQYAPEGLPPGETADQSWQALKTLLETRINAGLAGKVSTRSIDEILAEELATEAGTV